MCRPYRYPPTSHHPTTRKLDHATWSLAYPFRSFDWNDGVTEIHADALMATALFRSRWRADAEVRPYKKQVVTARFRWRWRADAEVRPYEKQVVTVRFRWSWRADAEVRPYKKQVITVRFRSR